MKTLARHAQKLALIGLLIPVLEPTTGHAAVVYMRSTVGSPWNQTTNETAMNTVFGSGNWSDLRYETVNTASLFTVANSFIYMEGSDDNANELESFITVNLSLVQNWVSNGGSLFINAAPNEGNGMDFGFGVSNNYSQSSGSATAADASHPIFLGPHGATGTSFTAGFFSHATVSGALTPLITGTVGTILGEADYGSGYVMFGGMTTDNFHSPQPQAASLRANIISYAAAQSVPEPSAAVMASAALLGLLLRRRRGGIDHTMAACPPVSAGNRDSTHSAPHQPPTAPTSHPDFRDASHGAFSTA